MSRHSVGNRKIEPPLGLLVREAIVVAVRIEAEEREAEAIFAASRAMATADVAAGPHEHGHHIELETNRRIDRGLLHADRYIDMMRLERNGELGVAIGFRGKAIGITRDAIVAVELPSRFIGDVPRDAVGIFDLHDDRLRIARGRQRDFAGVHVKFRLAPGAAWRARRLRRTSSLRGQHEREMR